jgi:Protein of unknown function (DUF1573)
MKRIILLVVLAVFSFSANAQEAKTKGKKIKGKAKVVKVEAPKTPQIEGAGMVFENETIDYGTIQQHSNGERQFVFTNNGSEPLVISSTQGSCGCTVPTTPKDPIPPGEKGVIGVKYATDRVGPFTKNVTVKSNAKGNETKVITIKGNVLAAEKPAAAEPTKS